MGMLFSLRFPDFLLLWQPNIFLKNQLIFFNVGNYFSNFSVALF